MKDVLEQVSVGAARNRFKEIAADKLASAADCGGQCFLRRLDDVREVEQDSAGVQIPFQDGREQRAAAAADVGDDACRGEVVGGGDGSGGSTRDIRLEVIEQPGGGGILSEPVERVLSVDQIET